jgi:hypothetical protein
METIVVRNKEKLQILTPRGFSDFAGISKKKVSEYLEIEFDDGFVLKCTDNHRIKIAGEFIQAKDLNLHKTTIKKDVFVYDPIDVALDHEYLVGNITNHNCVEFLGSSGTLIAGWKLKELVSMPPITQNEGLSMYKQPYKDHVYCCVVDVSRGKGLDYSAFSIIDITTMPYEQVCVFRNNMITPIDYADVVYRVAKSYNKAAILVEINDIGEQVSNSLHYDFDYDNILFTENAGRVGKRITTGFGNSVDRGIRTTKSVKSVGCSILKLLIEQNQLIINDFNTINELSTFSKKGISYEAEPGKHDDMVMSLVLFAWLSDQSYFKEITDINTLAKLRDKTEEDIQSDMIPFGFVDDGSPEEEVVDFRPQRNWMMDDVENGFL